MPHERTLDSLPSPPAVADAPRRSRSWPSLRQAWFQVHWFVGITAGSVLMLIGLAGATLAFREEIVDA
ncbi:MAG TPA: hypothetical protein VH560_07590, partial [Polyangia bacterium]|nr:hypothetical protein [Polyangia bacterium]